MDTTQTIETLQERIDDLESVLRKIHTGTTPKGRWLKDGEPVNLPWPETEDEPPDDPEATWHPYTDEENAEFLDSIAGECKKVLFAEGQTQRALSTSTQEKLEWIPCGGCGAENPAGRCINCFHDFGPLTPVKGGPR